MRRRDFIARLGGVMLLAPLAARGQQGPAALIGYLGSSSFDSSERQLVGFRQGLAEASFKEGQNLAIEYRWSDGDYIRLPAMTSELLSRGVSLILASGLPAALAAKAATSTIPIVFVMGADPVASDIVPSMNRPGGNVTGISQFYGALGGKRLELLREIVPSAATIAVLTNPNNPNSAAHLVDVQNVARATGQKIVVYPAGDVAAIDNAHETLARESAQALLVADDPFFTVNRQRIIAIADKLRLPAIYYTREYATGGGLISYGSSTADNYRLGGAYVGRILAGAKAGELPVVQPARFEMVINLKAAKSLKLNISPTVIARADEVIE